MTNVVRFPASRRIQATTIPREEFERLAELALDVVDRIVAILDEESRPAEPNSDYRAESLARTNSVRYTEFERGDRV
ncbi:hypothetical protein [Methylobacterium sp. 10]|uniref:hypothetical protein n=1 Tax=Methylobacterium sp. 10 TaxID=1101191 RepID=UPI0004B0AD58|nr:hypothetical protein [Methylobacterium sp. 10]